MLKKLFGIPEFPREPSFANLLYPSDEHELRELTSLPGDDPRDARAIVVPHSDLTLTASVMARGYDALGEARRAVVIGPSHKIPFAGLAVPNADGWTTPLGTLRIDTGAYDDLEEFGLIRVMDVAFDPEPAIELQLPWLQRRYDHKLQLIPLLCGDANPEQIMPLLERVWDDDTVLVVACELSRDLPEPEVRAQDEVTLDAIARLEVPELRRGRATSRVALAAAVELARSRQMNADIASYQTSTDLGGPADAAAGFAAIAMRPS